MASDDLSETDEEVIEVLREGRATKGYIVDETGYHRNTIGRRLEVLEAAGIVQCVHEATALYELVEDPRAR
jgi:uncharacterized membrane protein